MCFKTLVCFKTITLIIKWKPLLVCFKTITLMTIRNQSKQITFMELDCYKYYQRQTPDNILARTLVPQGWNCGIPWERNIYYKSAKTSPLATWGNPKEKTFEFEMLHKKWLDCAFSNLKAKLIACKFSNHLGTPKAITTLFLGCSSHEETYMAISHITYSLKVNFVLKPEMKLENLKMDS